jgi:signal transduction histidine kinase
LATSERGLDQREPLDLARLTERALDGLQEGIERRRIAPTLDLAPAPITGDRALLERLLANLLDNAVEHNREDGWMEVHTRTDAGRALLRVASSGPTIRPGDVERLFEPFQRGGATRIAANGHHGLGLSIARAIVLAHEGEINAAPVPGGGLSVTVSFPASP